MGSAYGGKHTGEAAIEAARLAKAAGRPVKLVWTREEEFTLGLLPPGWRDRREERRSTPTDASCPGSSTTGTPGPPASGRPTTIPQSADRVSPGQVAAAPGLVSSAGRDREPLRARDAHGRRSRARSASMPCSSGCTHLEDDRIAAVLKAVAGKIRVAEAVGGAAGAARHRLRHRKGRLRRDRARRSRERATGLQRRARRHCVRVRRDRQPRRAAATRSKARSCRDSAARCSRRSSSPTGTSATARWRSIVCRGSRTCRSSTSILLDRRDLPSAGAGEASLVCVAPAIGSAVRAFGKVDTALPVRLLTA